ncbi:MAG: hypothetical protein RLZZ420_1119, partial [Bacteroidota bacterium]
KKTVFLKKSKNIALEMKNIQIRGKLSVEFTTIQSFFEKKVIKKVKNNQIFIPDNCSQVHRCK